VLIVLPVVLRSPDRSAGRQGQETRAEQGLARTGLGLRKGIASRLLRVSAGSGDPRRTEADAQARRQWQYVLFSTHGLADTYNGMLSCLALASPAAGSEEDGFLQAQEVLNLELDTDLVMLSACQTGMGRLRGGEGLVGLSAAFFYAGAQSVCASLWQVPSGPTSQLVPELFKEFSQRAGKVDRAEALRQAQLDVLRHGRGPDGKPADYSSPFCWAAFVLMGEHR
jgi:CHAT domain-containing protein